MSATTAPAQITIGHDTAPRREGRVAFTGLDLATPLGASAQAHWANLLEGRRGFAHDDALREAGYPVSLSGQIPPASKAEPIEPIKGRLLPQTDRITRTALQVADRALRDARFEGDQIRGYEAGVAVTSVTGGLEFGQKELQALWAEGWREVSPYMSFAWYYAVHTGQISIRHGLQGPSGVVLSEQAGGLDSVAFSCRRIRQGTPVMLPGGIDSLQCPYGLATVGTARGVARFADADDYAPYDASSCGYLPGEGGAVLVLEPGEHAAARSVRPYGYFASHAATFDPEDLGAALRRAAERALERAGLAPGDIDVVFADAHGDPEHDAAEVAVLTRLFGVRSVPVTSPTPATGRMAGGGSTASLATALLSLREGIIPPTPLPEAAVHDGRLDLVRAPRVSTPRTALVLARGHGGFASALVVTAD